MEDDDSAGACGRVVEWEQGLPTAEELMPASHQLVPPALAAAFMIDVTGNAFDCPVFTHSSSPTSPLSIRCDDEDDEEEEEEADAEGQGESEDAASASASAACRGGGGTGTGWAGKKARMVWTPELHHRFVQAVAHLGDKGAVPKAIVRLINVDGLTRENVDSHLQKYRIYLKRTRTTPAKPPHPPPAYRARFPLQAAPTAL